MSDYSEFCEYYGGSASDPDFMDNWLSKYASETKSRTNHAPITLNAQLKIDFEVSDKAWNEIIKYISIFIENSFTKHYQVNQHIEKNNLWNDFLELRSKNNHGEHKTVYGIEPKYFSLICKALEVSGCGGAPLIDYEKY